MQNLNAVGPSLQISEDQLRDKLTIHFQNRKSSRGGDVMEVIYPVARHTDCAIVLFDDVKGRFQNRKKLTIFCDFNAKCIILRKSTSLVLHILNVHIIK